MNEISVSQGTTSLGASSQHGNVVTSKTGGRVVRWRDDGYHGVVIDPSSLPSCADVFASQLQSSLALWRSEVAFAYHDAENGYVMRTYWIPDEPCSLPCGPSHQIGIAAFVLNLNNQVIVVKEKWSCSCSGVWKLPTGFIDKSEELFSGAVREVKEETGARMYTELRLRNQTCCMLKPLSLEIQIDENEIEDAKWISVDELLSQQFYKEDEMLKRVMEICMATNDKNYSGFEAHRAVSKFDGKMSYLYYKDITN
ncbi:hypothetical protein SASPL_129352 [Salvia splendens]|uniref:Nudix hydrolase domain-containing protein n=1 Tax=Salvia splendens TaxID=180675 RepID=A0A8X8XEB3_SALSN|nr:hypothetical protein SASPL_129352 [Salvia splendens]